jgi:hypothetical protein
MHESNKKYAPPLTASSNETAIPAWALRVIRYVVKNASARLAIPQSKTGMRNKKGLSPNTFNVVATMRV